MMASSEKGAKEKKRAEHYPIFILSGNRSLFELFGGNFRFCRKKIVVPFWFITDFENNHGTKGTSANGRVAPLPPYSAEDSEDGVPGRGIIHFSETPGKEVGDGIAGGRIGPIV